MRIFNSDGSEAEMCGNGVRCFVKFVQQVGLKKNSTHIETRSRLVTASIQDDEIIVEMGNPTKFQPTITLSFGDQKLDAAYLDTGVPHVVVFVEDIEKIDLASLGPYVRNHPDFAPSGTNLNIAQVGSNQKIKMRTYERGVEGETLGCGTGAAAVAIAAAHKYQIPSPVCIETKSREELVVGFGTTKSGYNNISQSGTAHLVYHGTINIGPS